MTKLKSKKMTKSTFAIIIMAIVMVAMLAFGGTYAYFTASATGVTNHQIKTGKVSLTTDVNDGTGDDAIATFVTGPVVPGMEILAEDQKLSVTNLSTVETFIYVTFSVEIDGLEAPTGMGEGYNFETEKAKLLTVGDHTGWTALDGETGVYWKRAGIAITDEDTEADEIDFCTSITFNADNNYVDGTFNKDTSDTKFDVEGKTIKVTFKAMSIQAYGLTGNTDALLAADGYTKLTATN